MNKGDFVCMRKVRLSFGNIDSAGEHCCKNWPMVMGANAGGGMGRVHTNILKLCPDAADVPGKRVMMKVDGGPGRLNAEMLSTLCSRGSHLHSCVPNSTAVTQETNQNCGTFKTVHRRN